MFRIKICGITNVDDARAVVEAGADALGLNFYPKSPRYVERDQARAIVDALPKDVVKVGLFVNADADDVRRTFDDLGLDLIQLHGDEPPSFLGQLGDRPVMRAFRLDRRGLEPVGEYLEDCRRLGCPPRLVLVDAHVKGLYGGSGKTADWHALKDYPLDILFPPLVLAGGLVPGNVAEAIRTARPTAVDTASGVESSPGRKDRALVEAFVAEARAAFDEIGSSDE